MSEFSAKTIRAARKAKASRLGSADPHSKVDSSDWTPPEELNADVKTGARPLSRRAFKSGGKVTGAKAKANMGRKPRCGGGKAGESWVNRNVKEANEDRPGKKHVGGFKKGGRTHKANGGEETAKKIPLPPRRDDYFPNEAKPAMRQDRSKQLPGDYPTNASGYADQNRKRGGRTKKEFGGAASDVLSLLSPAFMVAKMIKGGDKDDDKKGGLAPAAPSVAEAKKRGGRTKKMDGGMMGAAPMAAPVGDARLGMVQPTRMKFGAGPQGTPYKKGGKVHSDEAMDKALIKKMVKPSARTGKAGGGIKKIPEGVSGLSPSDAEKWKERSSIPSWTSGPKGGQETFAERKGKYAPQSEITEPLSGDLTFKRGGKARTKRATGGGVFSGPSYPGKVPGAVGGRTAKAAGGAKRGKGKTNINIVIATGPKGQPQDGGMMPPPGMPGMPPGMQRPQAMPPGMPPMPPGAPAGGPPGMGAPPMPPIGRKSGGRITKVASSYKDMEAGSGGGEGRLQKTDIAKRHKGAPARAAGGKVYRSYKDMDAGAGSGMGRLEKEEIQKRKR